MSARHVSRARRGSGTFSVVKANKASEPTPQTSGQQPNKTKEEQKKS